MPLQQFRATVGTTAQRFDTPGPMTTLLVQNDGNDQIKIRTDGRDADTSLPGILPGQVLELRDLEDEHLSIIANAASTQVRIWQVWRRP